MQTGGNWLFETYNNNPQFEIEFNESQQQQTANLMVGLLSKRTIQLNISIFDNTHNKFKFLTDSATRLISYENEPSYDDGYQFIHLKDLNPGRKYLVIASTYKPNQLGEFQLMVNSNLKFTLYKVNSLESTSLFETSVDFNGTEYCFKVMRKSKLMIKLVQFKAQQLPVSVKLIKDGQVLEESQPTKQKQPFGVFLGGDGLYPVGIYTVQLKFASRDFGCKLSVFCSSPMTQV
ncbi:unnamed protein product [Ambrosiozyma monospora]|uniref:Unnamed protein product n=1 Tax=Ambrosiozyma monospora TaxID=43982 RepID=A0A9W6YW40_AMBMO|nr:unnamed protein product [Ambrosiozyma monospora]